VVHRGGRRGADVWEQEGGVKACRRAVKAGVKLKVRKYLSAKKEEKKNSSDEAATGAALSRQKEEGMCAYDGGSES